MKIGVVGCSHSSYLYGNPWHYYMGLNFNADIISASSPGGGNEMNIEKTKYILENNKDLDFFVFQITEPSRFVIGLNNIVSYNYDEFNDSNYFNNSYYYTFNSHSNDNNLLKILNNKYLVDDFIINNVITSDYNEKYKIFHTILAIENMCAVFNVKPIFFSWFVDMYKLSKESRYDNIIKKMNIINGCVNDFAIDNKIPCIPNNGHFDSINSERIYKEYLHDKILKIIKKYE